MRRPHTLRRRALALAVALSVSSAAWAGPASVWVYSFDQGAAMADAQVLVDGSPLPSSKPGTSGAAIPAGEHSVSIQRGDEELASFPLTVADDEQVQISFVVTPGRAPYYRITSSLSGEKTVDLAPPAPASAEPATAAETDIAAADTASDEPGTEPTGEEVTLSGITVTAGAMPTDDRAAFVDERRAAADVKEAISAEEISRAGDTDVGAAVKRVTGVTLVENKFVYVRGLGERYSSVLLNNAQLPSPDPTRRVVPLDLFPTEILEGILIQKTFSPERPAEFGGGTVQMRTKTVPEEFFLKVSIGTGWAQDTTFEDGLRYDGGSDDWLGKDDDTRKLPDSIAAATANGGVIVPISPVNPNGFTPQQIEQFGEDLSDVYDIETDEIDPPVNGTFSIGNSWSLDGNRVGFVAAVRYDQSWDNVEEQRKTFVATSDGLVTSTSFDRDKTERQVDLTGFLGVGAELGPNHRLRAGAMLLRQTTDEAHIDEGFDDSPDQVSRFHELEWIENQLKAFQFGGDHTIPQLHDLGITWNYSDSRAERYSPNFRRYRYDQVPTPAGDRFRYSSRSNNNQTMFSDLDDDVDELGVNFKLPFVFGDSFLDLYFGGDALDRERDSRIRRYQFISQGSIGNDPTVVFNPSLEEIFSDPNIRPDGFVLREVTRGTDNYNATQDLDAWYANADWNWNGKLRFTLGARAEDNRQEVTTFAVGSPTSQPIQSVQDNDDILPSFTSTWFVDDESQLRLIYNETLSRPDFRELSPAPFTDPVLDVESIGNPNLVQTEIKNLDLRYEYYFSPSELVSLSAFYKDFTSPIEKVQVPGTGTVLSFANADSAELYGFEVEAYRSLGVLREWGWTKSAVEDSAFPWEQIFVGLNYAWIDSSVELGAAQLNATEEDRPLQGQSRYVANFNLGYQHPEGRREVTLLYNVAGKRIAQVGIEGAPDIYEQPFHQVDLTYLERFTPEWALKVRLRNLLDDEVEFTQGSGTTRAFERGREVLLTVEWTPSF